jgi:hypothetical protein
MSACSPSNCPSASATTEINPPRPLGSMRTCPPLGTAGAGRDRPGRERRFPTAHRRDPRGCSWYSGEMCSSNSAVGHNRVMSGVLAQSGHSAPSCWRQGGSHRTLKCRRSLATLKCAITTTPPCLRTGLGADHTNVRRQRTVRDNEKWRDTVPWREPLRSRCASAGALLSTRRRALSHKTSRARRLDQPTDRAMHCVNSACHNELTRPLRGHT